jgi:hypothetical protein
MTCPVNVSLSGGYPDGRTRRRGQEPAEPPHVRGISVGFSASTTETPGGADGSVVTGVPGRRSALGHVAGVSQGRRAGYFLKASLTFSPACLRLPLA